MKKKPPPKMRDCRPTWKDPDALYMYIYARDKTHKTKKGKENKMPSQIPLRIARSQTLRICNNDYLLTPPPSLP